MPFLVHKIQYTVSDNIVYVVLYEALDPNFKTVIEWMVSCDNGR